jgi:ribosomal protein S18 acetylase RimI-like enzyme
LVKDSTLQASIETPSSKSSNLQINRTKLAKREWVERQKLCQLLLWLATIPQLAQYPKLSSRMNHILDNIVWHTLSGPHKKFSAGADGARRYAVGFSPIIGFANTQSPDFNALVNFCEPGEHFYCDGWIGPCPVGWQIEEESTMYKMVWEGRKPVSDSAPDAIPLTKQHAKQALELATLTRPGPFGLRTIELGEYFGFFDGFRLVAMAGERMTAHSFREISGVCTHPDFEGRGYGRRLMEKLILRQMERKETPFLHVMHDNTKAHEFYQRMGFKDYKESVVRVISRKSAKPGYPAS